MHKFFGTLNVQLEAMSAVWLIPYVLNQSWILEGNDLYTATYLASKCNLGEGWDPPKVS